MRSLNGEYLKPDDIINGVKRMKVTAQKRVEVIQDFGYRSSEIAKYLKRQEIDKDVPHGHIRSYLKVTTDPSLLKRAKKYAA